MNEYRYKFTMECPSDGALIDYTLLIIGTAMVMAEDLVAACKDRDYQEPMADRLHARFGGYQVITASHHGVHITTTRGSVLKCEQV